MRKTEVCASDGEACLDFVNLEMIEVKQGPYSEEKAEIRFKEDRRRAGERVCNK